MSAPNASDDKFGSNAQEGMPSRDPAGSHDTVEITEEMILAGVSVLLSADYRIESHANVVADILIAALKAINRNWIISDSFSIEEMNIV